MKTIKKNDYESWESYYWDYQKILAEDYYIPYLINEGKISLSKTTSIIDIGCGNGGFIDAVNSKFNSSSTCSAIGIDIKNFDSWKNKNTTYKVHNILEDDNKDYKSKYDLVILRDVIEHIHDHEKEIFIKTVKSFMTPDGKMLATFPPYLSPFGLHQQAIMQSFLKRIPYLSILPKSILRKLVMKFENSNAWKEIEEIIDSSMTISRFKSLLKQSGLSISKQRFFTVRPSHEIRYNIKSFRSPFGSIPIMREFLILGTCYLLKKNK